MNREIMSEHIRKKEIFLYGEASEIEEFIELYHDKLKIIAVLTDKKNEEKLQSYIEYGIKTVMSEDVVFNDEMIIVCNSKGFSGSVKRLRHLNRREYEHYVSRELVESLVYNKEIMVLMGTRLLFQVNLLLMQCKAVTEKYSTIYFDENTIREAHLNRIQEYEHICKMCDVYVRSSCEKERFYRKIVNDKILKQDCKIITVSDYGFAGFFPQYDRNREQYSDLFLRERERLDMHYGTLAIARKEKEIQPLCMENVDVEEILDKVLNDKKYEKQFICNYFDEEVRRLRENEVNDNVKLSDYIDANRSLLLCRNLDEWNEPVVSYVTESILQLLQLPQLEITIEKRVLLLEDNSGSDFLVYPCVKKALQLPEKKQYRVATYYNVRYMDEQEYVEFLVKYYKKAYALIELMGVDEDLENSIKGIDV